MPLNRLLFIAHRVPYPPDKGERVRAFHEIRALAERYRVTLAAPTRSRQEADAAGAMQEFCEAVITAPAGRIAGLARGAVRLLAGGCVTEGYFYSRHLVRRLAAEARREPFDLVMGYCSSTLPYVLAIPAAARLMDLVDVDSAKWSAYADRARWPRRWLYTREAAGVGRLERQSAERCDAVLLVSDAEADLLRRAVGAAFALRVRGLSNGVDTDTFRPGAVEPADLGPAGVVFTGQMDYRPNVDGVCWFVEEIWPALHREHPAATLTIVGRDPAPAVRRLAASPGVAVTGTVPDVRPYLAGAAAAVCPLRIARGIQNKVLEAMAMALPVVASPEALEGLDVSVGTDILRAGDPAQWRESLGSLLADGPRRRSIGDAARRRVETDYTWPARLAPLVSLCEQLATREAREAPNPQAFTA